MFLIRTCFISRLCRHSPKYFLINKICANLCSVDVPVVHKGLRSPTQDGPKEYPANILKIAEEIASLTLLEVAELNELLAKKLNIKTPAHGVSYIPAQHVSFEKPEVDQEVEQAPTKTAYAVKLMKFTPEKKVALIKEIKDTFPEMNLVQAKKFVEAAPGVLKKDLCRDEAEKIKKALEACGATVELE